MWLSFLSNILNVFVILVFTNSHDSLKFYVLNTLYALLVFKACHVVVFSQTGHLGEVELHPKFTCVRS